MAESDVYWFEWRGAFDNASVNALHAEAFDHELLDEDWEGQVRAHSLGWVCAHDEEGLVGFVNVPWDGGIHAFVIDTMVSARAARRGVGTRLGGSTSTPADLSRRTLGSYRCPRMDRAVDKERGSGGLSRVPR